MKFNGPAVVQEPSVSMVIPLDYLAFAYGLDGGFRPANSVDGFLGFRFLDSRTIDTPERIPWTHIGIRQIDGSFAGLFEHDTGGPPEYEEGS